VSVALTVGVILVTGCQKYSEVSSPEGLAIVRALYTACSSRNGERLTTVERRIHAALRDGDISRSDVEDFVAIIRQAEQGNWERAIRNSYRYAQDQVR
jgi:hypothetical protein